MGLHIGNLQKSGFWLVQVWLGWYRSHRPHLRVPTTSAARRSRGSPSSPAGLYRGPLALIPFKVPFRRILEGSKIDPGIPKAGNPEAVDTGRLFCFYVRVASPECSSGKRLLLEWSWILESTWTRQCRSFLGLSWSSSLDR